MECPENMAVRVNMENTLNNHTETQHKGWHQAHQAMAEDTERASLCGIQLYICAYEFRWLCLHLGTLPIAANRIDGDWSVSTAL